MASSVPEQIIAQIFALLPVEVTRVVGRREIETNAKSFRVVAVPLGASSIDEPDRPGDGNADPFGSRYTNAGRILLLRRFQVEWTCHGYRQSGDALDFARVEELYLLVLQACRRICHHSIQFSDERWQDQEEGADSFQRWGSVIRFTTVISIPVYETRGGLTFLTADPPIDTTFTLNGEEP